MLKASRDWFWKSLEQRPNRNIACCSSGRVKHTLFPEGLPGTPGDTLDFWRKHFQNWMLVLLLALNIYCFKGVYPLLFLLFIFVCYSGELERCCSYCFEYWCVESELSTLEPVTCWSRWVGSFLRDCSFKWNQPLQIMTTQLFSWGSFDCSLGLLLCSLLPRCGLPFTLKPRDSHVQLERDCCSAPLFLRIGIWAADLTTCGHFSPPLHTPHCHVRSFWSLC